VQPVGVVTGGDQQLGGGLHADAVALQQLGAVRLTVVVMAASRLVISWSRASQRRPRLARASCSPAEGTSWAQAPARWALRSGRSWPRSWSSPSTSSARSWLVAWVRALWRCGEPPPGRAAARPRRCGPWDGTGVTGQHGAGGGLGIDRVGLARAVSPGTVGAVHLHNLDAVIAEVLSQAVAVAAGALHACGDDLAIAVVQATSSRLAASVVPKELAAR
jgi:hypothetical protein